jgi:hypothetical protein
MSTIGIFGDSFAQNRSALSGIKYTSQERQFFDQLVTPAMVTWTSLLPDSTNHASGGTDLSWSFLQFLENHEKYDTIVFVITEPNRITLRTPHMNLTNEQPNTGPGPGTEISAVGPEQARTKRLQFKNATNKHDLYAGDAYEAIMNWQTHIQLRTPERDWLHYGALINELLRIRPDIKLIKAFSHPTTNPYNVDNFAKENYYPYRHFDNIPLDSEAEYMYNIVLAENSKQSFHERVENPVKWWDIRSGHISTESHVRLSKIITAWLQTDDTWLNFDVAEFKNNNLNADDYFIKIGTSLKHWQAEYLERRRQPKAINTKYDGKNR